MKALMTVFSVILALALVGQARAEEGKPAAEAKTEMSAAKPKDKLMGGAKMEKKQAGLDKGSGKKKDKKVEVRADGLKIEDVKVGSGAEAKLGSKITVHYRGTFVDGKEFDSSKAGKPISFGLEEGHLIKGWTEGIPGMKVGGKRKLFVPYALAYGERGTPDGTIGEKKDLLFDVELVNVE